MNRTKIVDWWSQAARKYTLILDLESLLHASKKLVS